MADDSVIKGQFLSARPVVGSEYRAWQESAFPQWADQWGLCLRPGQAARLFLMTGTVLNGTLKGFDRDSITLVSDGREFNVPLHQWERLDTVGGCSTVPAQLRAIPGRAWLHPPFRLVVRISPGQTPVVRSDSVVQTTVYSRDDRIAAAIFAGLAVDVGIALFALGALAKENGGGYGGDPMNRYSTRKPVAR